MRSAMNVLAAGLLLLGFATPLRALWAGPELPWWSPFALWSLAIVALVAGATSGGRGQP